MPQTIPAPAPPAERLAARICRSTNAKGSTDAGPVIAELARRADIGAIGAALSIAQERGWLRRNGDDYIVTPAGAELGRPRWGKRPRRVMPF